MVEHFKGIPGYEGLYLVSNYGKIVCCAKTWRTGKDERTLRAIGAKIKKTQTDKDAD